MLRKFFAAVSGLVSLTSFLFVCAALDDLITGDSKTSTGILIGLLVFFASIMVAMGFASVQLWRTPPFNLDELEPRVLQLARDHGGRVSVADVSIGLSLPLHRAQLCLDHLARHGVAEHFVTEGGTVVYGIRSAGALEKANAERV